MDTPLLRTEVKKFTEEETRSTPPGSRSGVNELLFPFPLPRRPHSPPLTPSRRDCGEGWDLDLFLLPAGDLEALDEVKRSVHRVPYRKERRFLHSSLDRDRVSVGPDTRPLRPTHCYPSSFALGHSPIPSSVSYSLSKPVVDVPTHPLSTRVPTSRPRPVDTGVALLLLPMVRKK